MYRNNWDSWKKSTYNNFGRVTLIYSATFTRLVKNIAFYALANISPANSNLWVQSQPHSSSYNLTQPISRVLIGQHLIFCSLTSPTCCNLLRKCTPVKYKKRQKAGFTIVT